MVDDRYRSLDLNPFGKYATYVQEIGKENDFYKNLRELITAAGDLPHAASIYF